MDSYYHLLDSIQSTESAQQSVDTALNLWDKNELKCVAEKDCNRILHCSCSNGWYDVSVRLIEEFGLDPNVQDKYGETALHSACRSANIQLAMKLISSFKCNPLLPNVSGNTPLHYAIMAKDSDMVQSLINTCGRGSLSNSEVSNSIMTAAWKHGNVDIIKCLINQCGCGLNISTGSTILHECVTSCNRDQLKSILDYCHCDPNVRDENGDTILHKCASMDLSELFICLTNNPYNCKPDIKNNKGETPLHVICLSLVKEGYSAGKCKMLFHLLVDMKISPHIKFNDNDISVLSAVCEAILQGHHDPSILHYLIIDQGCDPSNDSDIVLYTLCNEMPLIDNKNKKCIELLSFLTNKGFGPLFTSISGEETVCLLCCPRKCNPAYVYSSREFCNVCHSLHFHSHIHKFADSTFGKQLQLEKGAEHAQLAEFLWQLYANSVLSDCQCGETMLLFEFLKSYKPIKLLRDKNGNTVLHKLCSNTSADFNGAETFKEFISSLDCKPDAENNEGETPLHIICSSLVNQGYSDDRCKILFYLLMDANVPPHIEFNSNDVSVFSAIRIAINNGHHDPSILYYLIVDCGCDPSNDSSLILYTLCNSISPWGLKHISLLSHLVINMKLDPHVLLDEDTNTRKACIFCCPVRYYTSQTNAGRNKLCEICHSVHDTPVFHGSMRRTEFLESVWRFINNDQELEYIFKLFHYLLANVNCECSFHSSWIDCIKKMYPKGSIDLPKLRRLEKFGFQVIITSRDSSVDVSTLKQMSKEVDKTVYAECLRSPLYSACAIVCCLKPPYSSTIHSLFYDLISNTELNLMSNVDIFGNTLLHLACLFYRGDATLIEYLLSTGKTDPLCFNDYQQTPLKLLAHSSKATNSQLRIQELMEKFGSTKVSHPIESYVNIIILGNPGVGKSSLVKVINERHDAGVFARFRSVTTVDLCTAGIVPHIVNDKEIGQIIIHDLAGQVEYYSSHMAILDNLLKGSAAVFVIIVSLADERSTESLQFWQSVVENASLKSIKEYRVLVVASFNDIKVNNRAERLEKLQNVLFKFNSSEIKIYGKIFCLDCRKIGGTQLNSLISSLSDACGYVRRYSVREMSLYCHMLYDFLQHDGKAVYSMNELVEAIKRRDDSFLPTGANELIIIIQSLSSTGLIMYLGEMDNSSEKMWIIADKSVLLKHLNGGLFAPEYFKEHIDQLVSKTGIVKLSELFHHCGRKYNYDPNMIVQFLESMELSHEISKSFIISSNLAPSHESVINERYLFIPALIKNTNRPANTDHQFQFGWCLQCTKIHGFFLSQFIHLIILHLLKFTEEQSPEDSIDDRHCHIWKNGIYWTRRDGVSTLVELSDEHKFCILLMSFESGCYKHMTQLRKDVIGEILSCKSQVLLKPSTKEYVIDNANLQYPQILKTVFSVPLYGIHEFHKCYNDGQGFVLPSNGGKRKEVNILLKGADLREQCESVLAGRHSMEKQTSVQKSINHSEGMTQEISQAQQNEYAEDKQAEQDTAVGGGDDTTTDDMPKMSSNEDLQENTDSKPIKEAYCEQSPNDTTVHSILLKYRPQLLGMIGHPDMLAIELVAKDLLSSDTQDSVSTTAGINRYEKAKIIIDEVVRYFKHANDCERLKDFCQVLKNHGQPGLDELAEEIERTVN